MGKDLMGILENCLWGAWEKSASVKWPALGQSSVCRGKRGGGDDRQQERDRPGSIRESKFLRNSDPWTVFSSTVPHNLEKKKSWGIERADNNAIAVQRSSTVPGSSCEPQSCTTATKPGCFGEHDGSSENFTRLTLSTFGFDQSLAPLLHLSDQRDETGPSRSWQRLLPRAPENPSNFGLCWAIKVMNWLTQQHIRIALSSELLL